MPQELLNRSQVRAALEQIGRKGVAHRMRGNVGRDAGERRQLMEPSSEHSGTHAIAARRNKQRVQTGCGVAALCLGEQLRPPLLDIATSRLERPTVQRHDTLLAAFAPKANHALRPSDGFHVKRGKLRDASTRGIEQLEHRRIAQSRGRRGIRCLEQRLDLLGRKDARQVARQLGRRDRRDCIALDNPLGSHPTIQRPDGRQMRRKGARGHLATRELGQI